MDLNPIITPNTVLTDALNATIITNNGNEGVLLNDMGNGRISTAFLPEGYIPVGSCEFGDIIYIASYNPLINKCLLGCFPSPLRIITSTNIVSVKQSINNNDFQEFESNKPTGKLKLTTLTKIIYENNLQSGDKYIISAKGIDKEEYLSDLGNTSHIKDAFPKLYKISVVSVLDDGKIEKLTNGLKWYTKDLLDYFLNNTSIDSTNIDIDVWRNTVSSAYCIFSSKISGKLALLIELEKITGFSCTWGVSTEDGLTLSNIVYKDYNIHFLFNWETENGNINPSKIILYEGNWEDGKADIYKNELNQKGEVSQSKKDYIRIENTLEQWNNNPVNNNCWSTDISRIYKPENNNIFENYKPYSDLSKDWFKLNNSNLELDSLQLIIRTDTEGEYYLRFKEDSGFKKEENEYSTANISDDIVNNTFQYPIKKHFNKFELPVELYFGKDSYPLDLSNCRYKYKIAPCMPYGVLEELIQEGIIDFSKIDTDSRDLTYWKYYNQEGYSTITWGLEAYTDPGYIIPFVYFEFYDDKGLCAVYKVPEKDSYNGTFSNNILFGIKSPSLLSFRLKDDKYFEEPILHQGLEISRENLKTLGQTFLYGNSFITETMNPTNNTVPICTHLEEGYVGTDGLYDSSGNRIQNPTLYRYFENDAGIIYADSLYHVKIVVPYAKDLGQLGDYDIEKDKEEVFHRWFWTNKMFNNYYSNYSDFDELPFTLNLDVEMNCSSTDDWEYNKSDNFSEDIEIPEDEKEGITDIFAIELTITTKSKDRGNLNLKFNIGLANDSSYNFIANNNEFNIIDTTLYLPNFTSINSPQLPTIKFSDYETTINLDIYPNVGEYVNSFSIEPTTFGSTFSESSEELTYMDSDLNTLTVQKCYKYSTENGTKKSTDLIKDGINLNFGATHYSKYYCSYKTEPDYIPVIKAFISNKMDALFYNIDPEDKYFNKLLYLGYWNKGGGSVAHGLMGILNYSGYNGGSSVSASINDRFAGGDNGKDTWWSLDHIWTTLDGDGTNAIKKQFPFIFSYIWGVCDKDFGRNITILKEKGNSTIGYYLNRETILTGSDITNSTHYKGETGCITYSGNLYISDPRQTGRAYPNTTNLTSTPYIAPDIDGARTYAFLSNCFYKTGETTLEDITTIDNYIYLEDNYAQCKLDLIVRLTSDNLNCNNFIWFLNKKTEASVFQNYISNLLQRYNYYNNEEQLIIDNLPNITLQVNSLQKTFPIILLLPYIKPEINYFRNKNVFIDALSGIKEKVQDIANKMEFEPNVKYAFSNVGGIPLLLRLNDSIVFEASPLLSSSVGKYFTVSKEFIDRIQIMDGRLKLLSNPETSLEYCILYGNQEKCEVIKDIPGGFYIFKTVE